MIWIILGLFAAWIIGVIMGKGGFIHILLLNGIAVAVIKYLAVRRASQKASTIE